jgi:hypothetical protein
MDYKKKYLKYKKKYLNLKKLGGGHHGIDVLDDEFKKLIEYQLIYTDKKFSNIVESKGILYNSITSGSAFTSKIDSSGNLIRFDCSGNFKEESLMNLYNNIRTFNT